MLGWGGVLECVLGPWEAVLGFLLFLGVSACRGAASTTLPAARGLFSGKEPHLRVCENAKHPLLSSFRLEGIQVTRGEAQRQAHGVGVTHGMLGKQLKTEPASRANLSAKVERENGVIIE